MLLRVYSNRFLRNHTGKGGSACISFILKTSRFRPNPTWCILRRGLKTIWGNFQIYILCIFVFVTSGKRIFFSNLIVLFKGDVQFRKVQFLYFIKADTASYLVNVFISLFLDHNRCSYYYWHVGSFKSPLFLSFYFQSLVSTYFIISSNISSTHKHTHTHTYIYIYK